MNHEYRTTRSVGLDTVGRRFRIYVNDTFWQEVQDPSYYTTGVKVGVQGVDAGAVSFDYLMVVA